MVTYIAGYQGILSNDTPDLVEWIVLAQMISVILALFAEPIASIIQRMLFALSAGKKGIIFTLLMIVNAALINYNQSRNPHYIIDWFIKPIAIVSCIFLSLIILWLIFKGMRLAYSKWIKQRIANRHARSRKSKERNGR